MGNRLLEAPRNTGGLWATGYARLIKAIRLPRDRSVRTQGTDTQGP